MTTRQAAIARLLAVALIAFTAEGCAYIRTAYQAYKEKGNVQTSIMRTGACADALAFARKIQSELPFNPDSTWMLTIQKKLADSALTDKIDRDLAKESGYTFIPLAEAKSMNDTYFNAAFHGTGAAVFVHNCGVLNRVVQSALEEDRTASAPGPTFIDAVAQISAGGAEIARIAKERQGLLDQIAAKEELIIKHETEADKDGTPAARQAELEAEVAKLEAEIDALDAKYGELSEPLSLAIDKLATETLIMSDPAKKELAAKLRAAASIGNGLVDEAISLLALTTFQIPGAVQRLMDEVARIADNADARKAKAQAAGMQVPDEMYQAWKASAGLGNKAEKLKEEALSLPSRAGVIYDNLVRQTKFFKAFNSAFETLFTAPAAPAAGTQTAQAS